MLRAGRAVSALALAVVLALVAMLPFVWELGAVAAVASVPFRGR